MPEFAGLALPPKPHKRWLPRLRFSLRTLVICVLLVGSGGGLWWRWEPWVLERVWTKIRINGSFAGIFSPDGTQILLPTLGIYNLAGASVIPLWRDDDYVGAFSHSGNRVFLGGLNQARIVDAATGVTQVEIKADKTDSWIRSAVFSMDDSRVVADTDGGTWLWDEKAGNELTRIGDERLLPESQSGDGKLIAGGSGIYDASLKRIADGNAFYFFKDNKRVLRRTEQHLVIADALSGIVTMRLPVDNGWETRPCVSANEQWIAGFYDDCCVHVWNAETGSEQTVLRQPDKIIWGLAFSRDSTRLFANVPEKPICIWDVLWTPVVHAQGVQNTRGGIP